MAYGGAWKVGHESATADRLLRAADLVPLPVARLVQRRLNRQPLVNMVVTNIPGPPHWPSLLGLALASTLFLALAAVVFKRLEPRFAKVL